MDGVLQERDEYIEGLMRKVDELNGELFGLKRANSKLKGENRGLRRQLAKIRKEEQKNAKPFYKNGKRGSRYNG